MDYLKDLGMDCQIIFFEKGMENQTFRKYKTFIAENDSKLAALTKDSDVLINLSPYETTFDRLYKLKLPFIYECHVGVAFSYYLSFLKKEFVKGIVFPTRFKQNEAKDYIPHGIPSFSFPNCVGKNFFDKGLSVGIPKSNKKIILWVGRIEPNKNWSILIKLAKRVRDDYLIRIISDLNPLKERINSSEYPKLANILRRRDLQSKIQLISNCSYDEIPRWYYNAAFSGCYLSTSYTESFGMTVLEAMATQCPMVLSDLPTFREIAKDCALYFSPDDVDRCLENIYRVCEEKELRDQMIEMQAENIGSFEGTGICRNYLEFIQEVMKG
ncbi:MAG: glycosyltransferase [Clostridia bacterium]|nr:glycosyltransferase [Clostridia bacterium]